MGACAHFALHHLENGDWLCYTEGKLPRAKIATNDRMPHTHELRGNIIMNEFEHSKKELDTVQDGFDVSDTTDASAHDDTAQAAADAPPESTSEVDPTTLYDPITNRVRLLIARDIDPSDKVRVYIRIIVVAGILYYIGTGVWGILIG